MTPPPLNIVRSHVLVSTKYANRSYMLFTISPTADAGVLTYFSLGANGSDLELSGPFTVSMNLNQLRGHEFLSGHLYPVDVLRKVWHELLSDDDPNGWRVYEDNDTFVNFYNSKANRVLEAMSPWGVLANQVPLTPRRSSRAPFKPSAELLQDIRASADTMTLDNLVTERYT